MKSSFQKRTVRSNRKDSPGVYKKISLLSSSSYKGADEVATFLKQLGLDHYYHQFRAHEVGIDDLQLISKEDLISMNIPVGPRNRILKAIGELDVRSFKENTPSKHDSQILEDRHQELYEMILKISKQQIEMMKMVQQNQRAISGIMDEYRLSKSISPYKR